jgi:hypothetical protein
MFRRGQAMIETVIAVLIVTFAFLVLFRLSQMLMGKIMLEHAAMRVARARAVGFNDFMCIKAARVAFIPAAGKRVWPADGEEFDYGMELARIGIYMNTPNAGVANGVMEYEGWRTLKVDPGTGDDSRVSMYSDWFDLEGRAGIEGNYQFYMNDSGL